MASDVQSMIEELPAVEDLRKMDMDRQREVYDRTQAAYDAYMALSEAERAEISGGEEAFETLFSHFNSLVMPVEAEAVAVAAEPAEDPKSEQLIVVLVTLAALAVGYGILGKRKR